MYKITCVVLILLIKTNHTHLATPPLECIPDSDPQGKLYFGAYNVTQFGYPCQRWDSQTPHEHSQSALSDQENYCRNPDNKAMPWCYTTNPNRAWLFCIIKDCQGIVHFWKRYLSNLDVKKQCIIYVYSGNPK